MSRIEATSGVTFEPTEACAARLDAADTLASFRERFIFPEPAESGPLVYFCGNSLGLQPKGARELIEQEMDDWATLAVDAHSKGTTPWFAYHEVFAEPMAAVVGALPGEVVVMNSLTVNIHLMLVSFYRPQGRRRKILMEHPAFPSDLYAARTHVHARGLDPDECVIQLRPREGEHVIRTADIEAALDEQGDKIALVMLPGVNFFTGQLFDIERITLAARACGCAVGFDLAHAAGNASMKLHEWGPDFAVWCSYKYLNAGPGAAAGCFVHERHGNDPKIPRFAGWWGDDPATRFQMLEKREFIPQQGAPGWQLSNPSVLAMAPLRASLAIFVEAGIDALRAKSTRLTGFLRYLLEQSPGDFELITPAEPEAHGCQLSILVRDQPQERHRALIESGCACDFREPNVIRVAPVPLYNTFTEVWRFAEAFKRA